MLACAGLRVVSLTKQGQLVAQEGVLLQGLLLLFYLLDLHLQLAPHWRREVKRVTPAIHQQTLLLQRSECLISLLKFRWRLPLAKACRRCVDA